MALVQVNQSQHGVLSLGQVTTVQFLTPFNGIRVFNKDPTTALYCRLDNIDPAVGGDGSLFIAPATSKYINCPDTANPEIRLISAGIGLAFSAEASQTA